MILQALTDYYEAMAKKGEISKLGWCKAKVSFALNINKDGELLNVIPLKIARQKGKKMVEEPQILEVPEQKKRSSGVSSQFLCDNSSYVLGLASKENQPRALKCFECCSAFHESILKGNDSEFSRAVISFFKKWKPLKATESPILNPYLDEILGTGNIVFMLDDCYAQDDKIIKEAWDAFYNDSGDGVFGQCLVTGRYAPIARLHPSIKGVMDAQSSGASLVSFNATAYESYGHDGGQGLNAPVSEYASFAYTTALNKLLADKEHKKIVGDTTVVYWSETGEKQYEDTFNAWCFGEKTGLSDNDLDAAFAKIAKGEQIEINNVLLDAEKKFYVLGLAPNAARLSVRFVLANTFGNYVANLKKHYDQLNIVKPSYDNWGNLPLWVLLQETVNKNSRNKAASPLLGGAFTRAVLTGAPYPAVLLQSILLRIRAEQDDADKHTYKINRARAAIIKACLLRNYKFEEVITVSLNEQSSNSAYVLGRLFAVLEAVQEAANPGINATIKNRYFNSACATPSVVFPILLKLSNHHLRKIERGLGVYYEKQIGELQNKIAMNEHPLPMHMRLEEQGIFILGYYHQTQKRFEKKGEK